MDSDQDTACAVGCPIRRSRDQRSLASPPGFSQRATSFIASQCQGIHQMPLLALERHTQRQGSVIQMTGIRDQVSEPLGAANSPLRRHCGTHEHGLTAARGLPLRSHNSLLYDCPSTKCPGLPVMGMQAKACSGASCRVPVAPGAIAFRGLPKWIWRKPLSARTAGAAAHQSAERIGGGDRNRTDDPLLAKQVLSQLSYTPPGVCAANTATSGV